LNVTGLAHSLYYYVIILLFLLLFSSINKDPYVCILHKRYQSYIYLLHSLQYSYKMSSEKATNEQMDEFNKLILNLKNINVQIDDEDQTLFLLCLLPKAHDHFKKTLFL